MLFEAASSAKAMSEEIAEMQKEIEELQNFEETDQVTHTLKLFFTYPL